LSTTSKNPSEGDDQSHIVHGGEFLHVEIIGPKGGDQGNGGDDHCSDRGRNQGKAVGFSQEIERRVRKRPAAGTSFWSFLRMRFSAQEQGKAKEEEDGYKQA
jgi:hypothetical protein